MMKIIYYDVYDLRFPTSVNADGSDAMDKDGDHLAAHVGLRTDPPGLEGHSCLAVFAGTRGLWATRLFGMDHDREVIRAQEEAIGFG